MFIKNKAIRFILLSIILTSVLSAGILYINAADISSDNILSENDADDSQMRGIWLSYNEYAPLGLSIFDSEEAYRENADRFLEEAKKYGINTVFLHARAFDDAFWRSKTFHASKYIGGDTTLIAEKAYEEFDPFGVFLEEAHKYGLQVHAWLNPYRVNLDYFYDPADDLSTERILTAVRELLAFESNGEKVDGIHIDDYFYHARKGYYKLGKPSYRYAIVGSKDDKPQSGKYFVVTPAEKRANVNKMIKEVYKVVAEADSIFGISPAGNYDNDMKDGADIDTWLSEDGYLDYIIPQIYWSNQWGEDGNTTMYSDRLNLFLEKKKNSAKFYVGLALYKTEESKAVNDPGWHMKSTNLTEQIAELENKGADGYVFFSAQYLFRKCAADELSNVKY